MENQNGREAGIDGARRTGINKTRRNEGTLVRTAPAAAVALGSLPALFFAYRFLDAFDGGDVVLSALLPLIVGGLFVVFFALQGLAAGLIASTMEFRPFSLMPHLSAPVVFGLSILFGNLILGRQPLPEALLSVSFYLSGFLLYRARSKKRPKTSCALYALVPATVMAALVFVMRALAAFGFSADAPALFFVQLEQRAEIVGRNLARMIKALAGSNAQKLIKSVLSDEVLQTRTVEESYELLGDAYAYSFATMLRLLPAAATALIGISSYIAASLCNRTSPFCRDKSEWRLTVSGIGTLLFVISLVATSLFVSISTAGVFGVFLYSVRVIFLPVFFGVGVGTLTSLKKVQLSRHVVLVVVCVIFILISPLLMIPVIGVYGNVMRRVSEKAKNDQPPLL